MKQLGLFLLLVTAMITGGCSRNTVRDMTMESNNARGRQKYDSYTSQPGQSSNSPAAQANTRGLDNSNLLLGNPSNAGKSKDNYLLERPQHSMSYNRANGGPNWVSWHLDRSNLGNVRRGDFLPDPLLPTDWQIRPSDYRGSGYDRGHVCPSGDRTSTREDNTATFVMSNMLPQAPALNQHVWKDLEDYSRSLTRNNELYIIAGGSGTAERIADGRVNVPAVCWKILVVLPRGDNDLSRIDTNTRVIAVSMPNRDRSEIGDSKWSQWITSVAKIEQTTGYDFLSALPDPVEQVLEQKVDSGRAPSRTRSSLTNDSHDSLTSTTEPSTVAPPVIVTPPTVATSESDQQAATEGLVWVNTNSGIYHYPGTSWYGKTKRGEYMSEAQALTNGYRAARNGQ